MPTDANCTNRAYAHGEQSSEVSRMPSGESTAATESTGSLPSLPSLVLFSVSTQPWHAALARLPRLPNAQAAAVSFRSHSHHTTATTFPSPSPHMLLGQLLQTYQTLAFSGTVNQEHQTQHQTQPTPVAACCGDGLDRSCSAPTAVAACTIAVRCCSCVWAVSPKTLLCGGNTKRFRIGSKMNETVQN